VWVSGYWNNSYLETKYSKFKVWVSGYWNNSYFETKYSKFKVWVSGYWNGSYLETKYSKLILSKIQGWVSGSWADSSWVSGYWKNSYLETKFKVWVSGYWNGSYLETKYSNFKVWYRTHKPVTTNNSLYTWVLGKYLDFFPFFHSLLRGMGYGYLADAMTYFNIWMMRPEPSVNSWYWDKVGTLILISCLVVYVCWKVFLNLVLHQLMQNCSVQLPRRIHAQDASKKYAHTGLPEVIEVD
jgi:hypothetical protein